MNKNCLFLFFLFFLLFLEIFFIYFHFILQKKVTELFDISENPLQVTENSHSEKPSWACKSPCNYIYLPKLAGTEIQTFFINLRGKYTAIVCQLIETLCGVSP